MPKYCAICGMKIRLFPVKIKDGVICGPCGNRLPQVYYNKKEEYTGEELKKVVEVVEANDNAHPDMIQSALVTLRRKSEPEKKEDKYEAVRKYRQLLEEGIITEEEYEKKRKELLEL